MKSWNSIRAGLLGVFLSAAMAAGAGPIQLLKDINQTVGRWYQGKPAPVAGGWVLPLCTDREGCDLWFSDGTPAGTHVIADLGTPAQDARPSHLTVMGGTVYFFKRGPDAGLWRTDGTPAGTSQVVAVHSDYPPAVLGSNLYFSRGNELWKSDGTPAGTVLLTTQFEGVDERSLAVAGGFVIFQGSDSELWRTDGTPEGTGLLADVFAGGSGSPLHFAAAGSRAFFHAYDGFSTLALWVTDGTPAGTQSLLSLGTSFAEPLHVFGSDVFFTRTGGTWVSRGTPATTTAFAAGEVVATTGTKVFLKRVINSNQVQIDVSDGTSAPSLVFSFPQFRYPESFVAVGETVYLRLRSADGSSGELWKTDGTTAGTVAVSDRDLVPFAAFGPRLLASDAALVNVWDSDGTGTGTTPLAVAPGEPNNDSHCAPGRIRFGAHVYFAANDGVSGCELWRTDGTSAGTVLVKELAPGLPGGFFADEPLRFTVMGGTLYFAAFAGRELWRTDGTAAGTQLVKRLVPLPGDGYIKELVAKGSTLVFTAFTDTAPAGYSVWTSDGTAAGTSLVKGGFLFDVAGGPRELTVAGNLAYFLSKTSNAVPSELWRTDGTTAGTIRLQSYASFTTSLGLKSLGSRLMFLSRGPDAVSTTGPELWTSDGTLAGTTLVRDLLPGSGQGVTRLLGTLGNSFYFYGTNGAGQTGLWKSDGTLGGTQFATELPSSPVGNSIIAGSHIYFLGFNRQIVRTDGTPAGTSVAFQFPGSVAPSPETFRNLAMAGSTIYFTSYQDDVGEELWRTTGFPGNTSLVEDFAPAAGGLPGADVDKVEAVALGQGLVLNTSNGGGFEPFFLSFDTSPDVIAFDAKDGVLANSWAISDPVTIGGVDVAVPVSATNGEVCVPSAETCSCSTWSATTEVTGGQRLCVRHRSSGADLATVTTTLTIGGIPASFSSTTRASSPPTIQFVQGPNHVDERGSVSVWAERTGSASGAVTIGWVTFDGTAIAGQDFGAPGIATQVTGSLSWADGDLAPKAITVGGAGADIPLIADGVYDPGETFAIALSLAPGPYEVGLPETASVVIADTFSGIAMATGAQSVSEDAGTVNVAVNRFGDPATGASATYSTVNGTATAGTKFTATSGTLTWAAGDAAPKTISVPILNNSSVATGGDFIVRLLTATGTTLASPSDTVVTIRDDDNSLQFASAALTVTEGGTSPTLSVRRSGAAPGPVSVQWSIGGTAVPGVDFSGPTSGTLQWEAADVTARAITIPIINDSVPESPKQLVVTLANPVNAKLGAMATSTITLNDNDQGVAFSAASYSIAESAGNAVLQVTRLGPAASAASVRWSTANGSATTGQDFGTRGSAVQRTGIVSWLAGDATPKSIVVPILQDVASEGPETFTVVLSAPSAGVVLGTHSSATVTITDDDIPTQSSISFEPAKILVFENGGNATLTVRRQLVGGAFTVPATVNYATVAGTALATSDFMTRTGTLTWATGDSADKTITIPIVNNTVAETHEAFKVTLTTTSAGARVETPEATVTIVDDDESFPRFGAIPDGWTVPIGANAGWHASNDPGAYEGVFSLRSDSIDDDQAAQIEVTRAFAAGNITFRVKVSSEAGFDKLRFFIDDVENGAWSGVTVAGWQLFSVPITAGTHTLRWSYEKDGSASIGQDAAWIDAVSFP